jgi:hypothetical protein
MEIKIGGNLKGQSQFRFINGKHNQYPLLKPKDIEDLGHDDNNEDKDDINDKDVGRGQG